MKFMFEFENSLMSRRMYTDAEPFGTWHTTDFTYTDELGKTSTGIEAFEKTSRLHATLLLNFCHRPRFSMIRETNDGYECLGLADFYGNYKVPGKPKVTDTDGKVWDFKVRFTWPMVVYANALPIFAGAVNRKMQPQELMLDNAY
ncbi:hypothetical protein AA313_de0209741 [Arthrobotrys entomopaga]|nr:hypothetical protein AA313_de0209741 [Arthrobotrys entomopaga]